MLRRARPFVMGLLSSVPAWLALERGRYFLAALLLTLLDGALALSPRVPARVLWLRHAVLSPLILLTLALSGAPGEAVVLALSFTLACLLELQSLRPALPLLAGGALLSLAPRGELLPRDRILRMATYNIEYARLGPEPVAATIRSLDADVVALQEVVVDHRDGRLYEVFPELERLTGLKGESVVSSVAIHDIEGMGTGLLSPWPLSGRESLALPKVEGAPGRRVCLKARACVRGRTVTVVSAHLDRPPFATPRDQERQVRAIVDWIGDERPVVLAGDFNAFPIYPGYHVLRDAFTDIRDVKRWPSGTWPSPLPAFRIDWMFARGLRPLTERVVRRGPSDHFPVVADLLLPERDATVY